MVLYFILNKCPIPDAWKTAPAWPLSSSSLLPCGRGPVLLALPRMGPVPAQVRAPLVSVWHTLFPDHFIPLSLTLFIYLFQYYHQFSYFLFKIPSILHDTPDPLTSLSYWFYVDAIIFFWLNLLWLMSFNIHLMYFYHLSIYIIQVP